MSNGIDLERINWGNYDLIVIDESHNFRNGGNVDDEDDDLDIIADGEKKKVAEWENEMDVFKKGELFHLSEKQVAKVTKANVFKKTCIISKINLDGTVELEFKQ